MSAETERPRSRTSGLWLRLWVGITNSRKIQSLPDNLFRWWINLLCLSKEHNGLLPVASDIAWELRTSEVKVNQAISALMERGLVDAVEFGFAMHDWNEWQFTSDVSTERTRRFKERSRERQGNVPANVPGTLNGTAAEPLARASEIRVQSTETDIPPYVPPEGTLPKDGKGKRAMVYPPKFEEFWGAVWLKTGKDAALRQWKLKLTTTALQDLAIRAAHEQGRLILEQASVRGHSPVHPATWISQGRYLDEPQLFPEVMAPKSKFQVLAENTAAKIREMEAQGGQ